MSQMSPRCLEVFGMKHLIGPYINFQGRAREAMELYHSVLGGKLELYAAGEQGAPRPAQPGDPIPARAAERRRVPHRGIRRPPELSAHERRQHRCRPNASSIAARSLPTRLSSFKFGTPV